MQSYRHDSTKDAAQISDAFRQSDSYPKTAVPDPPKADRHVENAGPQSM
jgi:hypothetical protein